MRDITANRADPYNKGGGINNASASSTLSNLIISGNSTNSAGGGISNDNGSSAVLTNITISGNTTYGAGGGIYNNNSSSAILTNVLISGNLSWGPGGGIYAKLCEWGLGRQRPDLQRRLPPPTSPAIDAGDNSVVSATTDLAGNPRRIDLPSVTDTGSGIIPIEDMGAYERQGQPNQQPTLNQPANLVILEDATVQTVSLTGIGAGSGESETISITATSSNPMLIPDPTVSYTSPNTSRGLSFRPVANANGSATITITVQDSGGTNGGGDDTMTGSFSVIVTAVNDAPSSQQEPASRSRPTPGSKA